MDLFMGNTMVIYKYEKDKGNDSYQRKSTKNFQWKRSNINK